MTFPWIFTKEQKTLLYKMIHDIVFYTSIPSHMQVTLKNQFVDDECTDVFFGYQDSERVELQQIRNRYVKYIKRTNGQKI